MNLVIRTNSNDFNPLYTIVDLDSIKYETKEVNISLDESNRRGLKVLRNGFFPNIVICEELLEVLGTGFVKEFKTLGQAKKFIKTK